MIRRQLASALVTGAALTAIPVHAETADAATAADSAGDIAEPGIIVTGRYTADGLSTPQHQLPLVDTPQTVVVIEDDLLAEQGRRTLRDTMRNVTGVSFQAGEGNPPGGGA